MIMGTAAIHIFYHIAFVHVKCLLYQYLKSFLEAGEEGSPYIIPYKIEASVTGDLVLIGIHNTGSTLLMF